MSSEKEKGVPKPRRVRIQNDGKPGYATTISDADTGEYLSNVYHIRLVDIDAKDCTPKAILWTYFPAMDIVANAEIVEACPHCGQQKPEERKLDDDRIKTTINDTDLDFSIDKLRQLQDLQRSTRGNNIYPREAIVAFLEWLSDRKDSQFSSISLGDELSDLAYLFCEAQGWKFDQEYYDEVIGKVRANYPETGE